MRCQRGAEKPALLNFCIQSAFGNVGCAVPNVTSWHADTATGSPHFTLTSVSAEVRCRWFSEWREGNVSRRRARCRALAQVALLQTGGQHSVKLSQSTRGIPL